jgi:hypothetical protein
LIVSVGISAVLGIIAILTGSFGEFELRIVLTTLTISGASIGALASGAAAEAGRFKVLSTIGIALAILAAVLLIAGIWFEPSGQGFWKFTASTSVLAAATAHACLLSLAKLARRFGWARVFAFVAIYLLATLVILSIYFEPRGDFGIRLIGVASIIVAAITIMTPIFHRLSRDDFHGAIPSSETERPKLWATLTCPECGATQPNSQTETTCDRCACRFVLRIIATGKPTMKSTSTLGIKQE